MKCPECKVEIFSSTQDGELVHFVCADCGHCSTKSLSEIDKSVSDLIFEFEEEYSVILPESYKAFICENEHINFEPKLIKVKTSIPPGLKIYIDDGYVYIDEIFGVKKGGESFSIFDSAYLAQEWDLPEKLVLLSGDGHTWIALDYRECEVDPPVIFIEADDNLNICISDKFEELISNWHNKRST